MSTLTVFLEHHQKQLHVGELVFERGVSHISLAPEFVGLNLNLSPFKLAHNSEIQTAPRHPFSGLHGIFADSLPDGWGMVLMDRHLTANGLNPHQITAAQRLAYIGNKAMGALTYQPSTGPDGNNAQLLDLNHLAQEAVEIYQGSSSEVSEQLHLIGGSPGGARPKAIIGLNQDKAIAGHNDLPAHFHHWLVKFPTPPIGGQTTSSPAHLFEGAIEYVYAQMAQNAGIDIPPVQLIAARNNAGYFAIKRFDRQTESNKNFHNRKVHMHTLAGLIHADFRLPDCDYEILLRATNALTKSINDCQQVIIRMIFNIIAGNKDDHTKNFSYLMDEDGQWQLSPAYDLTFNHGINGHHSMAISGQGNNIEKAAIQKVAKLINMPQSQLNQLIKQVSDALSQFETLARQQQIPPQHIKPIADYIGEQIRRLNTTQV